MLLSRLRARPPSRSRPRGWARGVTLIEIMVVVAIIGIIAAIAVPNLSPVVQRQKLKGAAEEAANLLDRARRKAYNEGRCHRVVENGANLVLQRKGGTNGANCTTLVGANWDATMQTLRPELGLSYNITTTGGIDLIFRPNGRLRGDGDLTVTDDGAQIEVEHAGLGAGFAIKVTPLGRICKTPYLVGAAPTVTAALTCD